MRTIVLRPMQENRTTGGSALTPLKKLKGARLWTLRIIHRKYKGHGRAIHRPDHQTRRRSDKNPAEDQLRISPVDEGKDDQRKRNCFRKRRILRRCLYRFPRSACSRSIASNSALKLPFPKERLPLRWMIS